MFDIGFLELLLVAVVGLLILGPERLPGVIRQLASLTARSRQFVSTVKEEFEREANLNEMRESIRQKKALFEQEVREAENELHALAGDAEEDKQAEQENNAQGSSGSGS